jgi:2-methylcitrate dehydratase PrpD
MAGWSVGILKRLVYHVRTFPEFPMQVSPLTHQTAPLSRAIADRVIAVQRDQVPQDVWEYLKLCLADAVGIAFASRAYDFAHKSLDSLNLLGSEGISTIIGQSATVSLRDAALMNGLLVHGLDYDDTHLASVVHCSASAFPQRWRWPSNAG